jgi:hypothetical protein
VPVHAFYVASRAKPSFEKIALHTGGKCESLNVNSANGAELLTNTITQEILNNIGGKELVNTYIKMYVTKVIEKKVFIGRP